MNILDLIIYVIYSVSTLLMLASLIILLVKNRRLLRKSVSLEMNNLILLAKFEEMSNSISEKSIEESEGFLKFVSDSRDWAFTYIEDVQQALMVYDVALNTDDAKIINEAYKKLMSFLPDEDNVIK